MHDLIASNSTTPVTNFAFVDRRQSKSDQPAGSASTPVERRQFGNSYRNLTEDGRELAEAIDAYKVKFRRRYITTDEMLDVLRSLGYHR